MLSLWAVWAYSTELFMQEETGSWSSRQTRTLSLKIPYRVYSVSDCNDQELEQELSCQVFQGLCFVFNAIYSAIASHCCSSVSDALMLAMCTLLCSYLLTVCSSVPEALISCLPSVSWASHSCLFCCPNSMKSVRCDQGKQNAYYSGKLRTGTCHISEATSRV